MQYIIYGGAGFLGSAIIDRLLNDGHQVRVFDRPCAKPHRTFLKGESVEWIVGDITNANDAARALVGVDAVVYLISTTLPKVSNDNPIFDVQTNLIPILSLLDAMVKNGVKRIIYISSGGTVYGTPKSLPIKECHPTEPLVSYGIVKLAIEKYLLMHEKLHGIKAVILRVANAYGERQRLDVGQGAVGVFLNSALQNRRIEIWGDGSVVRDYIYVGDIAGAVERSLHYNGSASVFNIGAGVGTSLNQLLAEIETYLGRPVDVKYTVRRSFDISVSVLCNDLAKDQLGWKPEFSLADGIEATANWLRQSDSYKH